jgi:hypothetical protein
MITEKELADIEEGLPRWHSVSPQTALRLIAEVRRLQGALTVVWNHLDVAQATVEKVQKDQP